MGSSERFPRMPSRGLWSTTTVRSLQPSTRDPERPYLEDDITLTSANCATYLDQSPRSFMDMIRTSHETPTEIDLTLSEIASATLDTICTITWDRVRLATNSNDTMLRLVEIIEDGIRVTGRLPPGIARILLVSR